MNLEAFYENKKVLITGHTGFKGGWLSIWLHLLGADVHGYALDPTQQNGIFTASAIGAKIHDLRGDIRDLNQLQEIFKNIQPEIVFHLAAQPLVIESYVHPVETFEVNIQGTVHLLEAIRRTPSVKAAVMVTSDKCYENCERVWGYRESDPMGGHDPYSASKGAAELVTSAYRRSFFNKPEDAAIATARAGNVIGGGDWAGNRLVPDIFRSIERGEPIKLRNPDSIRPWQHVLEPLGGYLLLAARMSEHPETYSEAWNFGPLTHDTHAVKDVAERIISHTGTGHWIDISDQSHEHEANLLMLDITKAIKKLHWQPVFDFNDTIRLAADWYMNYAKKDVLMLTQQQIMEYQEKWKSTNCN